MNSLRGLDWIIVLLFFNMEVRNLYTLDLSKQISRYFTTFTAGLWTKFVLVFLTTTEPNTFHFTVLEQDQLQPPLRPPHLRSQGAGRAPESCGGTTTDGATTAAAATTDGINVGGGGGKDVLLQREPLRHHLLRAQGEVDREARVWALPHGQRGEEIIACSIVSPPKKSLESHQDYYFRQVPRGGAWLAWTPPPEK